MVSKGEDIHVIIVLIMTLMLLTISLSGCLEDDEEDPVNLEFERIANDVSNQRIIEGNVSIINNRSEAEELLNSILSRNETEEAIGNVSFENKTMVVVTMRAGSSGVYLNIQEITMKNGHVSIYAKRTSAEIVQPVIRYPYDIIVTEDIDPDEISLWY